MDPIPTPLREDEEEAARRPVLSVRLGADGVSGPAGEHRSHFEVATQERSLVESPTTQPAGHLVIGLAGIARSACRHDVVEGVTAPTGYRQNTIALQGGVCGTAIRAATPRLLKDDPLVVTEVVFDAIHAALAFAGGPSAPGSTDGHMATIRTTSCASDHCSAVPPLARRQPAGDAARIRDGVREERLSVGEDVRHR